MLYTIWDIVKIDEQYSPPYGAAGIPIQHEEWIVIWYELRNKIPMYKIWIIKTQYVTNLFNWYWYNGNIHFKDEISSKVFKKLFKRAWPNNVNCPAFESEKDYLKYKKTDEHNNTNYKTIIQSKFWERDNIKYNKVLAALAKAEAKAKAIT